MLIILQMKDTRENEDVDTSRRAQDLNFLAVAILLALRRFAGEQLDKLEVKTGWRDKQRRHTSGLINGTTPPWEMTTSPSSLFNLVVRYVSSSLKAFKTGETYSSSFRMANCKCRGTIRCFLLSRAAFPASSRISAARYSRTAAR